MERQQDGRHPGCSGVPWNKDPNNPDIMKLILRRCWLPGLILSGGLPLLLAFLFIFMGSRAPQHLAQLVYCALMLVISLTLLSFLHLGRKKRLRDWLRPDWLIGILSGAWFIWAFFCEFTGHMMARIVLFLVCSLISCFLLRKLYRWYAVQADWCLHNAWSRCDGRTELTLEEAVRIRYFHGTANIPKKVKAPRPRRVTMADELGGGPFWRVVYCLAENRFLILSLMALWQAAGMGDALSGTIEDYAVSVFIGFLIPNLLVYLFAAAALLGNLYDFYDDIGWGRVRHKLVDILSVLSILMEVTDVGFGVGAIVRALVIGDI